VVLACVIYAGVPLAHRQIQIRAFSRACRTLGDRRPGGWQSGFLGLAAVGEGQRTNRPARWM
jgi:hypothetical protein